MIYTERSDSTLVTLGCLPGSPLGYFCPLGWCQDQTWCFRMQPVMIFPVNAVQGWISRAKAPSPTLGMEDSTKYLLTLGLQASAAIFALPVLTNFLISGLTPLQHGSRQKPHEAPPSLLVNSSLGLVFRFKIWLCPRPGRLPAGALVKSKVHPGALCLVALSLVP